MAQKLSVARFLDLAKLENEVIVCGILDNISRQRDTTSVTIHDGSTIHCLTVRFPSRVLSSADIGRWATVQLHGKRNTFPDGQCGMEASEVEVVGHSDQSNPLNGPPSEMLAHPHLRIRDPWYGLLMRFRSIATAAISDCLSNHPDGPFYQVHHPIITWTDCEGGAEVFPVTTQDSKKSSALQGEDFFGGQRFLSVTAAIHGEAFAMGLDRVWMLTPSFRAERVQDDRHLAKFYMLEIALNYVDSLDPLLELCEDLARGLVQRLQKSPATKELFATVGREGTTPVTAAELQARWGLLCQPKWPRVTHAQAVHLMLEAQQRGEVSFNKCPGPEVDLSSEHENFLLEHFKRPVFVTHYPTKIRLFSALQSAPPQEEDGVQTTESVDLLLPGVAEVFSGGLREHRLDELIKVMRRKRFLNPENGAKGGYPFLQDDESLGSLRWFADLRRYGTSPHGGFGIGFERLLVYLTGAQSTKDVIAFPRFYQSCEA